MSPLLGGEGVTCPNTGLSRPECSCRDCMIALLEDFAPADIVIHRLGKDSAAVPPLPQHRLGKDSAAVPPLPPHRLQAPATLPSRHLQAPAARPSVAERLNRPAL